MSMSGTIRASIAVLIGLLALYILETTFGTSMASLYFAFNHLLTTLSISPGWAANAKLTLGNWVWFDRAFVICVIALFVWWAESIFVDVDYTKVSTGRRY